VQRDEGDHALDGERGGGYTVRTPLDLNRYRTKSCEE